MNHTNTNLVKTLTRMEINHFLQTGTMPEGMARCLLLAEALATPRVQLLSGEPLQLPVLKKEVLRRLRTGNLLQADEVRTNGTMSVRKTHTTIPVTWASFKVENVDMLLHPLYASFISDRTRVLLQEAGL